MAAGYYFVLLCSLFWAAVHDVRTHRVPNRYSAAVALYGSLSPLVRAQSFGDWKLEKLPLLLIDSLLGAILCGGVLLVVSLLTKGGFGGGDIKLMAGLGLAFGTQSAVWALLLAVLAAAFAGLIQRKYVGKDKKRLPFVPFLLFGCCMAAYFFV